MILTEISKYLQEHEDEIKSGKSTLSLVTEKLIEILKKQPKNNVEKNYSYRTFTFRKFFKRVFVDCKIREWTSFDERTI